MASGTLGEAPIERALATLDVFAHFCRASGLERAARSTRSPRARSATPRTPRSSSRARASASGCRSACSAARQEARYGYLAAVNSTTLERRLRARPRRRLAAARARGRAASRATSARWRLGTVLMSERFLPPNGPAKRKQLEELREHVAGELAQAAGWLPRRRRGRGSAARRHRRHRAQPRRRRAAGRGAALERRAGDGDRARGARRARAAPGGAARGGAGERPRHQARARRPDPRGCGGRAGRAAGRRLRRRSRRPRRGCARGCSSSGCSPARGRRATARRCSRTCAGRACSTWPPSTTSTSSTRATWPRSRSGCSTSSRALGLHEGDPRERELLWAACMLHDIGMSIDYDDHHKHSRYLILNGGLPGSRRSRPRSSRRRPATTARACRSPGPMAPLFGEGDAERLDRCAVLLRLAEDLERSRDQLVRGTRIALEDGEVELRLSPRASRRCRAGRPGASASCSRGRSIASSRVAA